MAASLPRGALSQAKFSALGSLWRDGPTNAGTLSRRMTIRPQSLTRILADLERAGFVIRTRAVEDGREHVLSLTPKAKEMVRAEGLRRNALLSGVMQHALSRNEIELLAIAGRILEKLADRWSAYSDVDANTSPREP
jgi:DNA-binding MarR family transcriptional regulator